MNHTCSRLPALRQFLDGRGWKYEYNEPDGLGSIDFSYRGVSYHIWEYEEDDGSCGVETNVRHGGRVEEITGDYETEIISELGNWH